MRAAMMGAFLLEEILIHFVPSLLAMSVFAVIASGNLQLGLTFGVSSALVLSILIGVPFAIANYQAMQDLPWQPGDRLCEKSQSRTLELSMPASQAFLLCTRALETMPGHRIITSNSITGELVALVGRTTTRSNGEEVSLIVEACAPQSTRVNIQSHTRDRLCILDNGKNLENVLTLTNCLNNHYARDVDK